MNEIESGNAAPTNVANEMSISPIASSAPSSTESSAWILRVEGRLETPAPTASNSSSNLPSASSSRSKMPVPGAPNTKFSHFLKSLLVEHGSETVEWTRQGALNTPAVNCDGFEIKRPCQDPSSLGDLEFKIHLQFNFAPERFKLAPELAALLGNNSSQLVTKPAIVLALWQYIKLHKLQESDEKKIINNDAALQKLFKCAKMSFSDIPVLMEPFLLPPEPLVIPFRLRSDQDLSVSPVVLEVEVEVDDPKQGPPRSLLPPSTARDLAFHESRIRELLDAMHASRNNCALLQAFAQDPLATAQRLLQATCRDYETILGDVPVTLDELRRSEFYQSEAIEQAVSEFLSLNPRYLSF